MCGSSCGTRGRHQSASSVSQAAAGRPSGRGDRQAGGRSLVGAINHQQQGLAQGCSVDLHVNTAGSGEKGGAGISNGVIVGFFFSNRPTMS